MDPDWFLPQVLALFQGRTTISWGIAEEVGTSLRSFLTSRLAWVDQLTRLTFVASDQPWLVLRETAAIPSDAPVDGLAVPTAAELSLYLRPGQDANTEQFVALHEIGHLLGLSHPYGNYRHPTATNQITIMSGTRRLIDPWRTWFSPLDIEHLQQAHGSGDPITGTPGPDRLQGTAGPDVLIGGGGPDRLRGRGGEDLLYGGGGQDQFILEPSGTVLIEDFSRRDSLLLRRLSIDHVRVSFTSGDASVFHRDQLLATIPRAPFLSVDHLS